jgi:biotin carboxylase
MKKLMILGAGIYQVPLIKTAKKMGLFTIVVSREGNYPGFQFADRAYYIDTRDAEEILKVAKKEKISGICTFGTDVAVPSIGFVANIMNLPGITFEASILSANKLKMREAFKKGGVNSPAYFKVKDLKEIIKAFDILKKPVILKAVDNSGSRGIVKINEREDIEHAYNIAADNTKKDYFIIEEFIEGTESGVQGFIYNNEFKFIMPHMDITAMNYTSFPIIHCVPYKIGNELEDKITEQLYKCAVALNLNNCAINADFIIKDNEIFIIEIGARSGGNMLGELTSIHYGFNYHQKIIECALDERPDFKYDFLQPAASMTLFSPKNGTIKKITDNNLPDSRIVDIYFDYKEGERVNKFMVGSDRIGHILIKDRTAEDSLKFLQDTRKNLEIVIE